jgi:SAM-dependent methyltransferase
MDLDTDKRFTGSIPKLYESHLVPLIFEPYAVDLAQRIAPLRPGRLLEVAAGTGVVTRRLSATLGKEASIVATDLNPAMLEEAQSGGTARPVDWRQADAMSLPFADGAFDVVVCQFGAMFFPDKAKAFSEARRVLRPGGAFLFSVWDRIEENEFADVVTQAVATLFPHDPPRFLARTPHGHFDVEAIRRDLRAGGFIAPARVDTVSARSRAPSAQIVAVAYCQGTPLRGEIESRDASRLEEATRASTQALASRFGDGAVDGKIQAHILTASA